MFDATPILKLYARRRLRQMNAVPAARQQEQQLRRLVGRARNTRFGRDHGFDRIDGVARFQAQVPLRRYEAFWKTYWQPAFPDFADATWPGRTPFLAVTSGTTTGRTKYIPVSREMMRSNRRAALDVLVHHLRNRPDSRVLGGRSFVLGGSTALVDEGDGVRSGDLSGIAATAVPPWARPYYFPPPDLALMSDWDRKVDVLGRRSLDHDIRVITGTASWLLLYFERLAEILPERGRRAADFYPNLELVVHGGVDFAPYRAGFARLLEGSHAELREVYPASEGFIAVADRGSGEGMRVIADNGLFLEFVPVEELDAPEPRRFWLGSIETGVNYAVVLSSCAGVWSYILGDTVRFVEREPPRLIVTGRIAHTLSAFGEHLIGEEIEQGVTAAADAIGAGIVDYTVGAVRSDRAGRLGGHLYVVEFDGGVPAAPLLDRFVQALDRRLCALNADYKDHRVEGFGIDPPAVEAAPPGTFTAWMRARGRLGGQNKVPRVITDPDLLADLRRTAAARRGGG